MSVRAEIRDGPLTDHDLGADPASAETGAALRFEGIVRRMEQGREILALDYQTYDPMAEQELRRLALDIARRHALHSLTVLHSRGRVRVGETSFLLSVTAAHRAEAIAAVTEFIDRLKRDVPIWKQPVR